VADYIQTQSDVVGYGIHQSYWVAVICFAYIAIFGFIVKGILRRQGIDYDRSPDPDLEPLTTSPESSLEVTKQ
jgi:FHS family L-fucose permease-like MFS transporter